MINYHAIIHLIGLEKRIHRITFDMKSKNIIIVLQGIHNTGKTTTLLKLINHLTGLGWIEKDEDKGTTRCDRRVCLSKDSSVNVIVTTPGDKTSQKDIAEGKEIISENVRFYMRHNKAPISILITALNADPEVEPLLDEALKKNGIDPCFHLRLSSKRIPQASATNQGKSNDRHDEERLSLLLNLITHFADYL